jgi:predicted PhzF superfamily epimerase YddE/YHI9
VTREDNRSGRRQDVATVRAPREDGMAELHVVRVFVGPDGRGGNPLGVFPDGGQIPVDRRQAVAADLGFSETVFVDDAARGVVQIFTPGVELPFAGHPLVGTAWLLAEQGRPVDVLRPPAGEVPTWRDGDTTWIRGRAEWAPEMLLLELDDPAAVDALEGPPDGVGFAYCWAFQAQDEGRIRARAFAPDAGIAEDEATGAAAVRLTTHLGRPVAIHQGTGSLILGRPGPDGTAEVGGRTAPVEQRRYDLRP